MPSSTSSSSRPGGARVRAAAWSLLGGFAAAALLAPLVLSGMETARDYRERMLEFPPVSADWSLGYDKGTVDHQTIAHRLDGVARGIANADVVVVGTSRAGVGFAHDEMELFFDRAGLRFYNLALGHGEGFGFAAMMLRRHGSRPGLVIANDDGGFFRRPVSEMGEQVLAESRFAGAKYVLEKNLSWLARRTSHAVLPLYSSSADSRWIVFRHRRTGSWWLRTVSPEIAPVRQPPRRPRQPLEIANARSFQTQMRELGAELILSRVPTNSIARGSVRSLARRIGVRAIAPEVDSPRTTDGSHLDEESARRFTRAFLAELEASPSFERLTRAGRR